MTAERISSQAGPASFRRRYGGPLPEPSGFVMPRVPVVAEPLPKLTVIPSRVYAEPIDVDDVSARGPLDELVRNVQAKLAAEDARLRRILPPAPDGYEWQGEVSSSTGYDYEIFAAHETIRLRYRLVKIGGE